MSSPNKPIHKIQRFEDFYRLFQDKPGVYKYQEQIKNIASKSGNVLIVLYEDLLSYDPQIAEMVKEDPEALLDDAIEAFKNLLKFWSGASLPYKDYFVRFNTKDDKSPLTRSIRNLRAVDIDKLVWIKGITVRSSPIRPKLIKATFECIICGAHFEVIQLTSKIKWPRFCPNKTCKAKAHSDFRLISKRSEFIDWQSITIQEMPEDLPSGRIPRSIQAILTYDLVDYVKPGDRVKLMGIFRSVLANPINSNNSNLFKTFLEVNYIDSEDKSEEFIDITKEELKTIEKLAKEPFIQKKIARSIAPSIYGRNDLKMACALSLFGGTRKKNPGGGYKRGDIHVLFVGDPGTGKSEVLKSVVEVSPRGLYTSGKGSSAVGLTAAVIKDPETGQMSLEAGAIVLANGGIAAIDEFDKMNAADRSALHEGMEQQSYHYDTEILATDGRRIKIGKFIDELMDKHSDAIIRGINCEILPFRNLELYSTDFKTIYKTNVNRVSRHVAPDRFYRITFTNGRSIVVTPEHPLYVFRKGKLRCIDAQACKINDFIPIPKHLPNSHEAILLMENKDKPHPLSKKTKFPKELNLELCRLLGFLISEGYSHRESGAEISFSNKETVLLDEFKNLMKKLFGLTACIQIKDGVSTLRYFSIEFYKWMKINFPEIMEISKKKRIPSKILGGSKAIAREFLKGAFKGDGNVESNAICFRTASKGLSHDYQDLLLKLGIQSRIILDNHNNSYKVYIRGQSLILFFNEIFEKDDPRYEKALNLFKPYKLKNHHHDLFPATLMKKIEQKIRSSVRKKNKSSNKEITSLELIENSMIFWDRIKKIEIIKNRGEYYTPWVYDITIEPNHTFISQGVILHNTVSIAKAGIVATLKSQTAIIAAANPKSGRFNTYKTFAENVNMPPSLLSRFDLIFKVIDRPDPAKDAQMAEFILKNATLKENEEQDDDSNGQQRVAPIAPELLKKYIKHAKRTCNPILSEEAKEKIKEFYLELRGQYDSEDGVVSILARNLDALIRMSEAHAKMALRDKVLKEDVEEIIKLFKRYLKDTGYDKETGKFDIDMILAGQPRTKLNKLSRFMDRLKEIAEENEWKALDKDSVIQILELEGDLDKEFIKNAIQEAIREGTLYEPKPNQIKFTRKET